MKRITLIVLICLIFFSLVAFTACETQMSEQERQGYLALAREYETKAATELAESQKYRQRASWTLKEWMSSSDREFYAEYHAAANYHLDNYWRYSKEAEKYRQMAQRK